MYVKILLQFLNTKSNILCSATVFHGIVTVRAIGLLIAFVPLNMRVPEILPNSAWRQKMLEELVKPVPFEVSLPVFLSLQSKPLSLWFNCSISRWDGASVLFGQLVRAN